MKGRNFAAYSVLALALGVSISIIVLTAGIVWTAIEHGNTASSLTENETQVLISSFSGIFGLLGAFIGYQVGNGDKRDRYPRMTDLPEPPNDIEDTKERWPTP